MQISMYNLSVPVFDRYLGNLMNLLDKGAAYAVEKKIASVEKLQGFDVEGYRFDAAISAPDRLVFRRQQTG